MSITYSSQSASRPILTTRRILAATIGAITAAYGTTSHASEKYLCARLQDIVKQEHLPSLSAGITIPTDDLAPLPPLQDILCAVGEEIVGSGIPVNKNTLFNPGSISKPFTGLLMARVIDYEKQQHPNAPQLTWDTELEDYFPNLFYRDSPSNPCYRKRTVRDLMAHVAGFPIAPLLEPGDQYMSAANNPITRRAYYTRDALVDDPAVPCLDMNGNIKPTLSKKYSGGSIIAAHMAERLTGQSWEAMMLSTSKPGMYIGNFLAQPSPFASGHHYVNSVPSDPEGPQLMGRANAPAGGIFVNTKGMAAFLSEFLAVRQGDSSALLPDAEWSAPFAKVGLSNYNRLGWSVGIHSVPTEYTSSPTTKWAHTDGVFFHNGGVPNTSYSVAWVVPDQNTAMFVMGTAEEAAKPGFMCPMNGPCDWRVRPGLAAAVGELAALRVHHGVPADMTLQQWQLNATNSTGAAVTINNIAAPAPKITDGRLTTKWVAPSAITNGAITLSFQTPRAIDRIMIAEDNQPNIEQYRVEYQNTEGKWVVVYTSQTGEDPIYPNRIFDVPSVVNLNSLSGFSSPMATKVRLIIDSSTAAPEIIEMAATHQTFGLHKPKWKRYIPKKVYGPVPHDLIREHVFPDDDMYSELGTTSIGR